MARRKSAAGSKVSTVSLILVLAALCLGLVTLSTIHDPPRVGIDALWVRKHRPQVIVIIVCKAVATAGTVVSLFARRQLLLIAALWVIALLIVSRWYPDYLPIITRVLIQRYF